MKKHRNKHVFQRRPHHRQVDARRNMKSKTLSWETTPSAVADAGRTMKTVNAFMGNHTISGADVGRNMKPQNAFMGKQTLSIRTTLTSMWE